MTTPTNIETKAAQRLFKTVKCQEAVQAGERSSSLSATKSVSCNGMELGRADDRTPLVLLRSGWRQKIRRKPEDEAGPMPDLEPVRHRPSAFGEKFLPSLFYKAIVGIFIQYVDGLDVAVSQKKAAHPKSPGHSGPWDAATDLFQGNLNKFLSTGKVKKCVLTKSRWVVATAARSDH